MRILHGYDGDVIYDVQVYGPFSAEVMKTA